MVRPIIEYAASVWDPHTLSNIESIQKTAARFCFNDFSAFLTCCPQSIIVTVKKNSS